MKLTTAFTYFPWLAKEIVVASVQTMAMLFNPRRTYDPVVVKVPLRLKQDSEVALFALSITMTPGTLTCTTAADDHGRYFLVHAVQGQDIAALADSFADMEERINPDIRAKARPEVSVLPEYQRPFHSSQEGA
ncbi:Na+/H+ antiporter subunit E [Corynebacterium ulceribovis]|uniref:Na+/H+ antiporter subunit E n=1 Tax=Corynebacterium ulceribovis TaxID=487732 RepID=UPI00036CC0FD|nr:Na+/H+ antiporter subunit E [Corynebacterium ulceribovis]